MNIVTKENSFFKRIHIDSPDRSIIEQIRLEYDLTDIREEEILNLTAEHKVNSYQNEQGMYIHTSFIIPKYDPLLKKYFGNEIDMIILPQMLITISRFTSDIIHSVMDRLQVINEDITMPIYELLENLYEDCIHGLHKEEKQILQIEEQIVDINTINKQIIEQLMIKKSNSIFLKHTLEPQQELRQDLFQSLQEMFEIDVNNYYNNINSKRQRTIRIVSSHYEILKALTLTYNALMNIASNKSIAILTIFTTIVGTLNFVVGMYGMNVVLPLQENVYAFWILIGFMILIGITIYFIFNNYLKL